MSELTNDLLINEDKYDYQKNKFLIFAIDSDFFGLEVKHVVEIIGIQEITKIPELPEYIKGVINLRGKIIPVMDIRLRFKKEFKDYNDRTCVIVVYIKNVSIGVIVDAVSEVVSIKEEDILDPPALNGQSTNTYIKGIGKIDESVKLILDCDKLINDEEFYDIQQI